MVPSRRLSLVLLLMLCHAAGAPALAGKLTDAIKQRDIAQVRTLLAAGEDVNEKVQGNYPLNFAALLGPAELVGVLLDAEADIEKPGRGGLRPLHNAAVMGHSDIVALLIGKGAVVDAKDQKGRTPLNYFTAMAKSDIETVKILLAAGADPNTEDMDQWAPLNYTVRYSGNVELGRVLIAAGADINHRKDNGESPVGTATFHVNYEFARMLILAGADVNQVDNDGKTPLSYVKDVAMRQLLIEAGAQ